MQVIGSGKRVVDMLSDFGLSGYEARVYFTLLTLGEAKVTSVTRKAYVPQSKAYGVLESLADKGFVELSGTESPKKYRAKPLEKIISKVISREKKFIKKLNRNFESLQAIVRAVGPLNKKYGSFRLFSPNFKRRCKIWTRQSL
jgi:sugar-specific transcriptional regulator TrmB